MPQGRKEKQWIYTDFVSEKNTGFDDELWHMGWPECKRSCRCPFFKRRWRNDDKNKNHWMKNKDFIRINNEANEEINAAATTVVAVTYGSVDTEAPCDAINQAA